MEKVCLTRWQRQELETVVHRSRDGQQVRRGQALLWLDGREGVGTVEARLAVTRQAVWHWKRRWQRSQGCSPDQVLTDGPKTGRPPTKRRRVARLLPGLLETSSR